MLGRRAACKVARGAVLCRMAAPRMLRTSGEGLLAQLLVCLALGIGPWTRAAEVSAVKGQGRRRGGLDGSPARRKPQGGVVVRRAARGRARGAVLGRLAAPRRVRTIEWGRGCGSLPALRWARGHGRAERLSQSARAGAVVVEPCETPPRAPRAARGGGSAVPRLAAASRGAWTGVGARQRSRAPASAARLRMDAREGVAVRCAVSAHGSWRVLWRLSPSPGMAWMHSSVRVHSSTLGTA